MPAAPRAASASLFSTVLSGRCAWSKHQRLLRSPEFVVFSPPRAVWRASRRWLALSALIHPLPGAATPEPVRASGVRFGITVSRRQARRAVARNAVKRVLRESARHAAAMLSLVAPPQGVDVLFRLKAPLPPADASGWGEVKGQLRREADGLLEQLHAQLVKSQGAPGSSPLTAQSLAQSAGAVGVARRAPPRPAQA